MFRRKHLCIFKPEQEGPRVCFIAMPPLNSTEIHPAGDPPLSRRVNKSRPSNQSDHLRMHSSSTPSHAAAVAPCPTAAVLRSGPQRARCHRARARHHAPAWTRVPPGPAHAAPWNQHGPAQTESACTSTDGISMHQHRRGRPREGAAALARRSLPGPAQSGVLRSCWPTQKGGSCRPCSTQTQPGVLRALAHAAGRPQPGVLRALGVRPQPGVRSRASAAGRPQPGVLQPGVLRPACPGQTQPGVLRALGVLRPCSTPAPRSCRPTQKGGGSGRALAKRTRIDLKSLPLRTRAGPGRSGPQALSESEARIPRAHKHTKPCGPPQGFVGPRAHKAQSAPPIFAKLCCIGPQISPSPCGAARSCPLASLGPRPGLSSESQQRAQGSSMAEYTRAAETRPAPPARRPGWPILAGDGRRSLARAHPLPTHWQVERDAPGFCRARGEWPAGARGEGRPQPAAAWAESDDSERSVARGSWAASLAMPSVEWTFPCSRGEEGSRRLVGSRCGVVVVAGNRSIVAGCRSVASALAGRRHAGECKDSD
jgi:hypothetical protein